MKKMRLETKVKLAFCLAIALLAAIAITTEAQTFTCPTLKITASLGGCDSIFIGWTYTGNASVVQQSLTYSDGFSPALPLSARSYSRTGVGPCYHTAVRVVQSYAGGGTCEAAYHDNHNRCDGCDGIAAGVSVVSSANFRGNVTSGSLVSLFPDSGQTFTDRQEHAPGPTLPTSLAGVSVEIGGTFAQLLDVSPAQINLLLPSTLPDGPTEIPIIVNSVRGTTARYTGRVLLLPQSPGIFTSDASGQGVAAFTWLLVRNGAAAYYAAANLPAVGGADQVFAIFYATGIKSNTSTLFLGNGRSFVSLYTGEAPGFAGLQQLIYRIPPADVWIQPNVTSAERPPLGAYVTVPLYSSQGFLVR